MDGGSTCQVPIPRALPCHGGGKSTYFLYKLAQGEGCDDDEDRTIHIPTMIPSIAQRRSLKAFALQEPAARNVAVSLQTAFDHPGENKPRLGWSPRGTGSIVMTPEGTRLRQIRSMAKRWRDM